MKKIAVGIGVILGFTLLQPVQAQEKQPSIVIIDTAVDKTFSQLNDKIIYELCIVEGSSICPNGKQRQEGLGSATLPSSQALKNGFEHGTIMSLVANQVNPNINIIFIRIAGMERNGKMGTFTAQRSINDALSWVVANKEQYNIVSVSSSVAQSMASLNSGTNYCPIRADHNALISNINKLQQLGVPTIFPSGNNGDKTRIAFPACIEQAVAIGGAGEDGSVPKNFNAGDLVDFYAMAWYTTPIKRFAGTSASAAAFSAFWAKNYKGSYAATYEYLKSISKPAFGNVTKGSFVTVIE